MNQSVLPSPVVAASSSNPQHPFPTRSIRIKTRSLRTIWNRFTRRIATPSSVVSESLLDVGQQASDTTPRNQRAPVTLSLKSGNKLQAPDLESHDKPNTGTEPQTVEVIVVDNSFASFMSDKSVSGSEHGISPEKSASHREYATTTDGAAESLFKQNSFLAPWVAFRYRFIPVVSAIFAPKFHDPKAESNYVKELWHSEKLVAFFSGLFWVANWVLGIAIVPKPLLLPDEVFFYALSPLFSLPMPILVYFDWPLKHKVAYQLFLGLSTWSWAIYQLFYLYLCGLYNPRQSHFTCGGKDFLALFYYTTALQTIALFGLKLNRFAALLGGTSFLCLFCALAVPNKHTLIRTTLNFLVFQLFLIYLHWSREMQERRLHSLRMQLKIQYIATQKAQVSEKKTADSKRRLTSYIFHEVRVPLNTALLAVQNMAASGVWKNHDIEFTALEGSLNMMSKVLNDVLDFNRMETGRFESVFKPFSLHRAIRSMLGPLRLAADAKNLKLEVELDKEIDLSARRLLYKAQGISDSDITNKLATNPEEEGVVVGDEMRLRQVLTNFASNASKFTPSGGKITLVTKLINPKLIHPDMERTPELSAEKLQLHNSACSSDSADFIVVRIEIRDTGLGIKPQDLTDNRLFSAYVQTELGRSQGGKGTGLGLALIRHIVSLGKGRLGVSSCLGKGSTFWIELAFGVGKKALVSTTDYGGQGFQYYATTGSVEGPRQAILHSMSSPEDCLERPSIDITQDDDRRPRVASSMHRSSSVFKTIMEQDGLVEVTTSDVPSASRLASHIVNVSMSPGRVPSNANTKDPLVHRPSFVELPPRHTFSRTLPSPTSTCSNPPTPAQLGNNYTSSESSLHFEKCLNVLCVDDDTLTRTLMKKMLTRLGCTVHTASDGQQALDLLLADFSLLASSERRTTNELSGSRAVAECRSRFDIIFLDNQMPIMSGVDLTARLRQLGSTDFIVGVTGNAMASDVEEYKDAGANHVLTKPVMELKLRSMLSLAHEKWKAPSPFYGN